MFDGPRIVLPVAWTVPVFPVMRTEPITVLPLNSTPALLPVSVTGPTRKFAEQASPPTTTGPVAPVTLSGPVMREPQMWTDAPPAALIGPVTVAPSRKSVTPAFTVTGPVCRPLRQTACTSPTLSGPADEEVEHGGGILSIRAT